MRGIFSMQFFSFVIVIIMLFIISRVLKENDEGTLFLKLIGYFFLGFISFNLGLFMSNSESFQSMRISLPIGFIISLMFFHPTINKTSKRIASFFGFILFIAMSYIVPIFVK